MSHRQSQSCRQQLSHEQAAHQPKACALLTPVPGTKQATAVLPTDRPGCRPTCAPQHANWSSEDRHQCAPHAHALCWLLSLCKMPRHSPRAACRQCRQKSERPSREHPSVWRCGPVRRRTAPSSVRHRQAAQHAIPPPLPDRKLSMCPGYATSP